MIVGRDLLAVEIVQEWARRAQAYSAPRAKIDGAIEDAAAIAAWQAVHGSKVPD